MKLTWADKAKRIRQKVDANPNIDTEWAEYRAREFEKRKQVDDKKNESNQSERH